MSSSSRKVVAIHQPNFFPWLGYFDKIVRSDIFILMDNVQFPRTGSGTWVNRVNVLVNKEARWLTVPVKKTRGTCLICEAEIDNSQLWRKKVIRTISLVTDIVDYPAASLSEYNINAITALCDALGIDTGKLVPGRELDVHDQATDLLISMTKAVGGTDYMCGGGAGGYQDDEGFAKAGVGLVYQNFMHPHYHQGRSEFTPGLSIIDAFMYCGLEGLRSMLLGGAKDETR
jgi:hypothetical protein